MNAPTKIRMAADDEDYCGAEGPSANGLTWTCTRPSDHVGDHAAHLIERYGADYRVAA